MFKMTCVCVGSLLLGSVATHHVEKAIRHHRAKIHHVNCITDDRVFGSYGNESTITATQVPEPEMIVLFSLAVGSILLYRRKTISPS